MGYGGMDGECQRCGDYCWQFSTLCEGCERHDAYERGKTEAVEGAKAYRRGYEVGKEAGDAAGYARAKAEIVAWLAGDSDQGDGQYYAAAIQRGEHIKVEKDDES